jgi:tetratricopeptide (TPR) repeat protein
MNTPNTRSMLSLVLYFNDSPALDDRGNVLVQSPHEKGSIEPPSLDGTISSEESSDSRSDYPPKKIHEMSLNERVEYAQELKGQAGRNFASKDYKAAYSKYSRVVEAIQIATETSDKLDIAGRVPAVMLLITCSIKAATCARNLEQWDDTERFALNATVIIDRLEPKLGENLRLQVDQTAYLMVFGEWRVKSLLLTAHALTETQRTEQAVKILKKAQDVITKNSSPEYAQKPLLKSSLKRLSAQDEDVLRLQAKCIRQRQAELLEAQRKRIQDRALEKRLLSPPLVIDVEEAKEDADSPSFRSAIEETPAPLPRESPPNGTALHSDGKEMSTTPKEDATESKTKKATLSTKQNSVVDDIEEEATLAWYHNMRALTSVLAAVLVVSFAVRSRRR